MKRFIGIQHRTKKTKEGEARPTMVTILVGKEKPVSYELKTEDEELSFAHARFVTKWRTAEEGEDLDALPAWQVCTVGKADKEKTLVAVSWDGLSKGDVVTMILGGSGDNFAFALSRKAEDVNAVVQRCTGKSLNDRREVLGKKDKTEDAHILAELGRDFPALMFLCKVRDRRYITVRELWFQLEHAMHYRIACEVQLRQRMIGERFRRPDGLYPEGTIEDDYNHRKSNDAILQALLAQEKRIESELVKEIQQTTAWPLLQTEAYKGVGPRIAARIFASVIDICRFIVLPDESELGVLKAELKPIEKRFEAELAKISLAECPFKTQGEQHYWRLQKLRAKKSGVEADQLERAIAIHKATHKIRQKAKQKSVGKLTAFCGAHVQKDGKFPRRRAGQTANYSPAARQALYLLADQWVKRPNTYWGAKLRVNKERLREIHPEAVIVDGKKKYTDGHIHKMAIWRTITQFVRRLATDWMRLEGGTPLDVVLDQKLAA